MFGSILIRNSTQANPGAINTSTHKNYAHNLNIIAVSLTHIGDRL